MENLIYKVLITKRFIENNKKMVKYLYEKHINFNKTI
jgi:hypothetical protein